MPWHYLSSPGQPSSNLERWIEEGVGPLTGPCSSPGQSCLAHGVPMELDGKRIVTLPATLETVHPGLKDWNQLWKWVGSLDAKSSTWNVPK